MCFPAFISALGIGGAGATAAGATVAAGTAGGWLQTLGTIISVGGSLYQGVAGARAARDQERAIADQRATEANLAAIKDQRERRKFGSLIRLQAAELAARGVQLDSPTAMLLGETAAREMSFQSQATRSEAAARDSELAVAQRGARADRLSSMLKGVFTAADSFLTAAPDLWPGLGERRLA